MLRRQHRRRTGITLFLLLTWALLSLAPRVTAQHPPEPPDGSEIRLVSTGMGGPANHDSVESMPSADGKLVVFTSFASNLVLSDTNEAPDIFLRDMSSDGVERISRRPGGLQANGSSGAPAITPDGRFITYYSFASNLVANDTNGYSDLFLVERAEDNTFTLERISMGPGGVEANGDSFLSDISDDGNDVVFDSSANLTVVDDFAGSDIFWLDRGTGVIEKISKASDDNEPDGPSKAPRIAGDGSVAVFYSEATNLLPGDNNLAGDIFLADLATGELTLVSVNLQHQFANAGALPEFEISADGRYVVFASTSSDLVEEVVGETRQIYLRDFVEGTTTLLSDSDTGAPGDGASSDPTISANGRFVGFSTLASNLFPTTSDDTIVDGVFVDTFNDWLKPVAAGVNGEAPDGASYSPHFSDDGQVMTFSADASNLVPGDSNARRDVFWRRVPPLLANFTFLPAGLIRFQASLCLAEDSEPNNTTVEAGAKLPLCQGVAIQGTLLENDADDYYKLVLTTPSMVTVEMFNISSGSDFDLYLYNSDRAEIAASRNNGNSNEQIGPMIIGEGTYYIRVYPDPTEPGGARRYQLRWRR